MVNEVMFKSSYFDWETPPEIFDPLQKEFNLQLDVCADDRNTKCRIWYSQDALSLGWAPYHCWMNPPYGREIGKWVQKAWDEAGKGALVVCLLPARTDTKWWGIFWDHENHCPRHKDDEIRYLKGRVKFVGADHPAPFPSAIVIMKPRKT